MTDSLDPTWDHLTSLFELGNGRPASDFELYLLYKKLLDSQVQSHIMEDILTVKYSSANDILKKLSFMVASHLMTSSILLSYSTSLIYSQGVFVFGLERFYLAACGRQYNFVLSMTPFKIHINQKCLKITKNFSRSKNHCRPGVRASHHSK